MLQMSYRMNAESPQDLSGATRRPPRAYLEIQRRRKLERALPDVRAVLDHADAEAREAFRDRVAPLVALMVSEIAVLDRQTRATDSVVMRQYGKIIADVLDLHDDPFRALTLWRDAASAPLARFGKRWSAYLERAARDSEGKYRHERLVDLDAVSAALGLTRHRMIEVFGDAKCILPPVRMIESPFTVEEARDIRSLSDRIGYTTRRIRDLALSLEPEAFCTKLWPIEVEIIPEDQIAGHRLHRCSDAMVSRYVKRSKSKPGPLPNESTLKAQITAIAAWRGESFRKVRSMYDKRVREASSGVTSASENVTSQADSGVTFALNSCHVCTEFPHSEKVTFRASEHDETGCPYRIVGDTVISHPVLIAIVNEGRFSGRRKRHEYPERELVEAWHIAVMGEPVKPATLRKWAQRRRYPGYLETARRWKAETDLLASDDEGEAVASIGRTSLKMAKSVNVDSPISRRVVTAPDGCRISAAA